MYVFFCIFSVISTLIFNKIFGSLKETLCTAFFFSFSHLSNDKFETGKLLISILSVVVAAAVATVAINRKKYYQLSMKKRKHKSFLES